ncbi:nicotinate (nicotinamide) nucleotide adenylyltransferase [bacterium]|nr:nicotinate (nicotinamide) nucleotide adenylyltransferase [bacterium]
MNIAIFGGSFNPVHRGHYEIVRHVNSQMKFHKIFVVPAYRNPFKENLPSIPESVRVMMLRKTFSEFSNVEICLYELNKQKTSYTFATLEHLKKQYSNHQFFLILGEDAFTSFHLWTKADKIAEICNLLVFSRPAMPTSGKSQSDNQGHLATNVHWMSKNIPDISATEIRNSPIKTVKEQSWLHPEAEIIWEQSQMNH